MHTIKLSLFCIFAFFILSCTSQFESNPKHNDATELESELLKQEGVEGTFEHVIADNFSQHTHEDIFYLKTDTKRISLDVSNLDELPKANSQIKVFGPLKDNKIIVQGYISLAGAIGTQAIHESSMQGTRKIGVIITNYNGDLAECTASTLQANFTAANAEYRNLSSNKFGFEFEVLGPYNFNPVGNPTSYELEQQLEEQLEAQLIAQGKRLSDYDHLASFLPRSYPKTWEGLAWIGGRWSYYRSCGVGVINHELGHNFGLNHAGSPGNSYGDRSDFMGYAGKYLNAAHMEYMGWMTNVQNVNQSGTYEIGAVEMGSLYDTHPQALRIYNPVVDKYVYFSYRTASDLRTEYKDQLNVHHEDSSYTTFVGSTDVGETYTDAELGLSVSVLSKNGSSMQLSIELTCVQNPPQATFGRGFVLKMGKVANYDLKVVNADSPACTGSSTISLSSSAPHENIHTDVGMNHVELKPGAFKYMKIQAIGDPRDVPLADYSVSAHLTANGLSSIKSRDISGWDTTHINTSDTSRLSISSPSDNQVVAPGSTVSINLENVVGATSAMIRVNGYYYPEETFYCTVGQACTYTLPDTPDKGYVLHARYRASGESEYKNSNAISFQTSGTIDTTDHHLPEVRFTSHGNDFILPAGSSIRAVAMAWDNVAIDRVVFYDYFKHTPTCVDYSEPYECDWTPTSSRKTLQVVAYDTAGNESLSECCERQLTVTLVDEEPVPTDAPPSLTILSPTDGAHLNNTVIIEASANDDVGVVSVKFFINNELVHTDSAAPYTYSWDTSSLAAL